jgi:DNA-binding PadR family transcriptional regulator
MFDSYELYLNKLMPGAFEGRNLWALTVLCLLWEGPLHPYEMLRLIRERRKDRLLDLRRGSIYNTIHQLERTGLIEPVGTIRDGRWPERTVYRLTDSGREAAVAALRRGLASPAPESLRFLAAVSFLARLTPEQVHADLSARAAALGEIEELESGTLDERGRKLEELGPDLARVVLLDADYQRTMRRAELEWVRRIIADLEQGRLRWSFEEIVQRVRSTRRATCSREPGVRRR